MHWTFSNLRFIRLKHKTLASECIMCIVSDERIHAMELMMSVIFDLHRSPFLRLLHTTYIQNGFKRIGSKMNEDVGDVMTGPADNGITEFATYEEYLDSQITPNDLFYLEVPCHLIGQIIANRFLTYITMTGQRIGSTTR